LKSVIILEVDKAKELIEILEYNCNSESKDVSTIKEYIQNQINLAEGKVQ